MLAEQNLREGNLKESLNQLERQVREDPSNAKYRVFLFQLLAVMGDWDRGMTQLNVAADLDASNLAMAQTYREALRCEVLRAEIFAGKRAPLLFGKPEKWLALLLEAHRLTAMRRYAESQQVRNEAFESAPPTSGTIDGTSFGWIADADLRLGPVLEVIMNGNYYWVPFHRIRDIHIEKPVDLRDVVWMPAYFTWANGGETVGLIPTRYPGSEASEDPPVRMARKTIWIEQEADCSRGEGQRQIATDAGEYSIMDIRRIELNTADELPNEES